MNGPSRDRHSLFTLLELHLLFKRKPHRLGAHIEHTVHFCIGAVVLQAAQDTINMA